MPVHLVGDVGKGVALESLGQNACRFSFGGSGLVECCDEGSNVVSVDYDGMETKALHSFLVGFEVVSERGGVRLKIYYNEFEYLNGYHRITLRGI